MDKVTTAAEFFTKYDLLYDSAPPLDRDLRKEGFQNDDWNIYTVAADYRSLSPKERYAVFVRLRDGGDAEFIKHLVGFDHILKATRQNSDCFSFESRFERLRAELLKHEDIWERRLAIAEETFVLENLVQGYVDCFAANYSDFDALKDTDLVKRNILQGLATVYRDIWPDKKKFAAGNPLWDSDGDFDPYFPDEYFDNNDPLPLDPECSREAAAGICDLSTRMIDKLAVGESRENDPIVVTRTGKETIEFAITLKVAPDPEGNADAIKKKYLNPEFLARLKRDVEEEFANAVEKGPYQFSLNMDFQISSHRNHHDVLFTDRDIERSNEFLWGKDLFVRSSFVLHEIGHHVGWPDYYNEAMVSGGVRDFTTRPGYAVIGGDQLMACSERPKIPQSDLLKLMAKVIEISGMQRPSEDIDLNQPVGLLPFDAYDTIQRAESYFKDGNFDMAEAIARYKLEENPTMPYLGSNLSGILLATLIMKGKDDEADAMLSEFGTEDLRYISEIAVHMLFKIGETEEAKNLFWKYRDWNDIGDQQKYALALEMTGLKRERAVWFMENIFGRLNPESRTFTTNLIFEIKWLEENGLREMTIPYYKALLEKDPTNLADNMGYTLALFANGDTAKAEESLERLRSAYDYLSERGLAPFDRKQFEEWIQNETVGSGIKIATR